MVDSSNYSPSDSSVCQQMSLPLTYDNGINLLPKRCDDDEAYFACEVPCEILTFVLLFHKTNYEEMCSAVLQGESNCLVMFNYYFNRPASSVDK